MEFTINHYGFLVVGERYCKKILVVEAQSSFYVFFIKKALKKWRNDMSDNAVFDCSKMRKG